MGKSTQEPQYDVCIKLRDEQGLTRLGLMSSHAWHKDPKRLTFTLARYKFVAKMLSGKQRVLEVGCADAFATRIVQQEVGHVTAIDFDPLFIADAKDRTDPAWPLDLDTHDMVKAPYRGTFDAAYSLDVLEHIAPEHESAFLGNIAASLPASGVFIVGIPSLASQGYASTESKEGHVNCKDGPEFKRTLQTYFDNVFLFSMNDEVVHTGFHMMAHYLFAVCCGRREP